MKKRWEKPKLVVLVRARPEESCLAACKAQAGGTDPGSGFRACQGDSACTGCSSLGS